MSASNGPRRWRGAARSPHRSGGRWNSSGSGQEGCRPASRADNGERANKAAGQHRAGPRKAVITGFNRPKRIAEAPIRGVLKQELGQGVAPAQQADGCAQSTREAWPCKEVGSRERRCSRSPESLSRVRNGAEQGGGLEARNRGSRGPRGSPSHGTWARDAASLVAAAAGSLGEHLDPPTQLSHLQRKLAKSTMVEVGADRPAPHPPRPPFPPFFFFFGRCRRASWAMARGAAAGDGGRGPQR